MNAPVSELYICGSSTQIELRNIVYTIAVNNSISDHDPEKESKEEQV